MPAYIVFYGNQIRGTHEEHLHQTKAIKLKRISNNTENMTLEQGRESG